MPIKVRKDLSAKAILEREDIFMTGEDWITGRDIRPLEILILNLIPIKEETETQLLRMLSDTPLQVDCTFLVLSSHISRNTSASHLSKPYVVFADIRKREFDGMIIIGAPVEYLEYEEVDYWGELSMIMGQTKTHMMSTMYIRWGMQAGFYYHYGIPKYKRDKKLSGIYRHRVLGRKMPLVRSMGGYIMAPHSRHTEVYREDTEKHPELVILAESPEASIFLVTDRARRQIFVQGHPEYDRMTLNGEYHRDLVKGISPKIPCNYYEDNGPFIVPVLYWRNATNMLYANWLNLHVYQEAPYNLDEG